MKATQTPCLIQDWTATPSQNWIIDVYKYGMNNGNGYVNLQVPVNPTTTARAGVITIAWPGALGVNYNVTQAGANPFQGEVWGTWSGTCVWDQFTSESVSGGFHMIIDVNGGVSGTYTGLEGGPITGSVSNIGGLVTQGTSTTGGGSNGLLWSGNFAVVGGALTGGGNWRVEGLCSGTWATN